MRVALGRPTLGARRGYCADRVVHVRDKALYAADIVLPTTVH